MSDTDNDKRSREAWKLAGSQHGVVARRQLLALGFSPRSIEHRIERGRLHLIMHGVYAVGWPDLTRERRWMAAVLACGDEAMLSHLSAAALWDIGSEQPGVVDVSVRRRCELNRPGLRVRGRPMLAAQDLVAIDGIPATAPARTLVDLATVLSSARLERAVNEADKRNLIDPETLRATLGRYSGEPGVRLLRHLIDGGSFRLSDSDLEVSFRSIVAAAGLPPALSKQTVNGWEVDFFWPDLGLVVETDGLRYHRTPSTQTRDVHRDRTHVIAGMTPLRFTHYEINYESSRVCKELAHVFRYLQARIRH
jgi:very-short-patch-repair endonuclease